MVLANINLSKFLILEFYNEGIISLILSTCWMFIQVWCCSKGFTEVRQKHRDWKKTQQKNHTHRTSLLLQGTTASQEIRESSCMKEIASPIGAPLISSLICIFFKI